ncbi:MAG: hypothetical protein J5771_06840 [Bacteroidales bacterium]|nr:hypothetical protein [Bacteroidales bacterium]
MKTKLLFKDSGRRSYAPPVASITPVHMQGVLCESPEEVDYNGLGLNQGYVNDYSGTFNFE